LFCKERTERRHRSQHYGLGFVRTTGGRKYESTCEAEEDKWTMGEYFDVETCITFSEGREFFVKHDARKPS
jgi:hypothetical protein